MCAIEVKALTKTLTINKEECMRKFIDKVRMYFAQRAENKVKKWYIEAGNTFGDAVSYLYIGECVGFRDMLATWEYWEQEIVKYGYKPFDVDAFIGSGGHNKKLPEFEKLSNGEEPVFHAKIYREKYF